MKRLFYFNPYRHARATRVLYERLSAHFVVIDGLRDRIAMRDAADFRAQFDVLWLRSYFRPYFGSMSWRDREMFKLHEWFNLTLGLGGGHFDTPCFQHPVRALSAESKPLQLAIAEETGFLTPRTLITNDWTSGRAFAESLAWDVILKPVDNTVAPDRDDPTKTVPLFTRKVGPADFPEDDARVGSPVILQARIDKAFELRVTCVGERSVFIRIDSQADPLTVLDYRQDMARTSMYSLTNDRWGLSERCAAYLDRSGLDMGVFDIAVDRDGAAVFLECNPNGRWDGLVEEASDRIARMIVDRLRSKAGIAG